MPVRLDHVICSNNCHSCFVTTPFFRKLPLLCAKAIKLRDRKILQLSRQVYFTVPHKSGLTQLVYSSDPFDVVRHITWHTICAHNKDDKCGLLIYLISHIQSLWQMTFHQPFLMKVMIRSISVDTLYLQQCFSTGNREERCKMQITKTQLIR